MAQSNYLVCACVSLSKVHLFGPIIQEEVQICIDNLTTHAHSGSPINLSNVVMTTVENILCRLIISKRASELVSHQLGGKSLHDLIFATSSIISQRLVSTWIPSLGFLDRKVIHLMDEMHEAFDIMLEELLVERKQQKQRNYLPRTQKDFLDTIEATNCMTRGELKNIMFVSLLTLFGD